MGRRGGFVGHGAHPDHEPDLGEGLVELLPGRHRVHGIAARDHQYIDLAAGHRFDQRLDFLGRADRFRTAVGEDHGLATLPVTAFRIATALCSTGSSVPARATALSDCPNDSAIRVIASAGTPVRCATVATSKSAVSLRSASTSTPDLLETHPCLSSTLNTLSAIAASSPGLTAIHSSHLAAVMVIAGPT